MERRSDGLRVLRLSPFLFPTQKEIGAGRNHPYRPLDLAFKAGLEPATQGSTAELLDCQPYSIPYMCFIRHSAGVMGLRGASVTGLRAGGGGV